MSCFRDSSVADQIIDDALFNAKQVLDGAKGLLALCPIRGLDAVPATLSVIIGMVLKTRGNGIARNDLAKQILALANIVKNTLELADSKVNNHDGERNGARPNRKYIISPELENRVSSLNQKLENLTAEAEKLSGGSFFIRCLHSNSNADILSRLKGGVEEATRNFSIHGQVTIEMLVNSIAENLERAIEAITTTRDEITTTHNETKKTHNEDVKEKALKTLPFVNASYSSSLNPTTSGVLEGTRTDLLRELEQWTDGPDPESGYDPRIYVLSGGVGTGKSTIAYEMANKLDNPDHQKLAASFFFVRNAEKLNTARHVLPTIAYQLARNHPEIYPHIADAADAYVKQGKHGQQLKFDLEDLIIKPLKKVSSSHPRLTIIIDALDECTESAQGDVVELLFLFMKRIPEIPFPLRVLITTRPELHIQEALNDVEFRNVAKPFKLQDIPKVIVDQDVNLFLYTHIGGLSNWGEICSARPTVIEDLTRHAGGLFIYAATVVKVLKNDKRHAVKTLDALLSDDPTDAAFGLRQLDRLYLTVLQGAFDDDILHRPHFKEWVQTVLGSVAILEDHVSMMVLQDIVGIDVDDAGSVLDRLESVILLPENQNNEIRVLHASFPQFLVDKERCVDEIFYIDASVHHGRLALDCLNIMTTTTTPLLVENVCRLEDPLVFKSDISDLQKRINEFIPEHLRYACTHWATHLSKSTMTPEIMEPLVEFTSTKLLAWVEVLVYLKRLDIAVTASSRARKWLLENNASTKTRDPDVAVVPELLNDVYRLVLQFFTPINECTGHIYNTALPLSPSCKLASLYSSLNKPDRIHYTTHMTSPHTSTWGPLLRVIETGSLVHQAACAAFSPDGLLLASASVYLQIWDANTGMLKKTMVAGDVHCLAWAPDGKHIVSCSRDKSVQAWNAASGAQVHVQEIQGYVHKVAWNPTGTQIIVVAKKLHLLTMTPGKDIKVTKVIEIEDVRAISKNANHAISTPQRRHVCVWDIGKRNFIELPVPEDWRCQEVEFVHNDTQVIASSEGGAVRVWDWKTGKLVHLFQHPWSKLTVSPNGDLVAIGYSGISIWDPRTPELSDMLTDTANVIPLSFSSDNERLVSSKEGSIQVWDLTQRAPQLPQTRSSIFEMVFSTDGSHIAATIVGQVSRVIVLCRQSGLQLCELPTDWAYSPSFSPDTQMLVVQIEEGVQIWDLSSTELSQPFLFVPGKTFAWSTNSRWLAVDTPDYVEVFDAKTGTLAKKLKAYDTWCKCSLEFSHDSTLLYFKSEENELIFKWEEGTRVDVEEHRWNTGVERSSGYYLDDSGWVTRRADERKMCWLPTSRRCWRSKHSEASWGDYYAAGSETGEVTILYFGTDPGNAVVDTN